MVNPLGVVEPMVGWKREPLSIVAITSGVISDKCFTFCILKLYADMYAHNLCSFMNGLSIRLHV